MMNFWFYLFSGLMSSQLVLSMEPIEYQASEEEAHQHLIKAKVLIESNEKLTNIEKATIQRDDQIKYRQTTGTIIGSQWILTCCHDTAFMPHGWVTIDNKKYAIEQIYPHPQWSENSNEHDFALVKLSTIRSDLDFPKIKVSHITGDDATYSGIINRWCGADFSEEFGIMRKGAPILRKVQSLSPCVGIKEFDDALIACGNENLAFIITGCNLSGLVKTNMPSEIGDSGGGLFDSNGHLIGVLSQTVSFSCPNVSLNDGKYKGALELNIDCFAKITDEIKIWIEKTVNL